MKIKFEWERISDNNNGAVTARGKVIGGWLVHTLVHNNCISTHFPTDIKTTCVFVPDQNHEWEIETE